MYAALTEPNGLRSWRTSDSVTIGKPANVAEFGFGNRAMVVKVTLEWILTADGAATSLDFVDRGWKNANDMFALCNSTWGA